MSTGRRCRCRPRGNYETSFLIFNIIFQANEWRQAAKEALDKFYADRDEKMSQTRKMNRESADALKLDNDSFDPTKDMNDQEKWDQVTQRIDFNAKGE